MTPQRVEPPPKGEHREIKLEPRGGLERSVHLMDRPSALAINAALTARRPLLLRGEPGVGKSQLARAAADVLGRAFVPYTVNSRTETNELLYEVDLVARLAEAQLAKERADRARLALRHFVRPGPMWWAFDWGSALARLREYQKDVLTSDAEVEVPDERSPDGVVVLIDELDKADGAIPNGLLDALGHRGFAVPGMRRVCLSPEVPAPLIVFTTNNERGLPDAFVRRCFVHTLALPKDAEALLAALVERGRAHNKRHGYGLDDDTLEKAADQIVKDRLEGRGPRGYRAGVAEYLDLLSALQDLPAGMITELAAFVLRKQGDDR